jgi:hypothetical protein
MTGQKNAQVMGIYSQVLQVIDFDKTRKKLELCKVEEVKTEPQLKAANG